MNKLIFLLSFISFGAFSSIVKFEAQQSIKASEINSNFTHLQSLLSAKNTSVNFGVFEPGHVILKDKFEAEFNKLRLLGVNIDPLSSEKRIQSEELNRAFNQSQAALSSFTVKNCSNNSSPGTQTWNSASNSWGSCLENSCVAGQTYYAPTAICNSGSKTKIFYPLKLAGGSYTLNYDSSTDHLIQFMQSASTSENSVSFSGTYNLRHGATEISTELVEKEAGTYASTSYCDSTADSKMCMVRFKGNTTLNGLHIPQVRKKGFAIFVDGDLTINSGAEISMTSRGAAAVGQNVSIISGQTIGATGGSGTSRYNNGPAYVVNYGYTGGAGVNGACGGGGSGAAGRHANYTTQGGAGAAGTSWSGGSGGGGAYSRTANSYAGDAAPNGGAGGYGAGNWDWGARGGAGNPGGAANGDWSSAGASGTGGTIILIVNGNLIHNGTITAQGISSDAGGSSGGGSINVFYKGTKTGAGTTNAAGGPNSGGAGYGYSGAGGAGSVRVQSY